MFNQETKIIKSTTLFIGKGIRPAPSGHKGEYYYWEVTLEKLARMTAKKMRFEIIK